MWPRRRPGMRAPGGSARPRAGARGRAFGAGPGRGAGSEHPLEPPLDAGVAQHRGVALFRPGRKHHPPQSRDPQQEEPLLRIGEVAHRREPGEMVVERKGCAHHQKPLRPSEPVEGDVQGLADVAAGAVGAHQEKALEAPGGAAVLGYHRGDARRVFFHPGHFAGEEHFRPGHARQLLVQQPVELELLALEPVGVRRDVGDASEVELGDAARALPVLKGGGLEPHGQKIVQHPGGGQHVEGGRMEGGGPQRFRQRGLCFQHGHRHPVLRQVQRHHEPHGSGSRHQHAIGVHVTCPRWPRPL